MRISIIDQNGNAHEVNGVAGWTAMEAIRDAGLAIRAECGGHCSCATCHVYVDPEWQDRLPQPSDLEADLIDMSYEARDNSRLSCQIVLNNELENLTLTLAPGTD